LEGVAALPVRAFGTVIGARCAGVQVTDASGQPPGWVRSLVRWATVILVAQLLYLVVPSGPVSQVVFIVVLFALVYGPALLDSRRRSLNDRAAGTFVLYRYRYRDRP
jgi:uncharacterized RDD family membrane protein YckC